MKKLFSALTLAAAGLISQVTNASEATWADDPSVVYNGNFEHKICVIGEGNKPEKVVYKLDLLSTKETWDTATKGKSDAEKKALHRQLVDLTRTTLAAEWNASSTGLTIHDVETMTKKYVAKANAADDKTIEAIKKKTGVEVLYGVAGETMIYPGCDLK